MRPKTLAVCNRGVQIPLGLSCFCIRVCMYMYSGKFCVNHAPYILVGCSTCIRGHMRHMTQESVGC